jgi:hypothetical protein
VQGITKPVKDHLLVIIAQKVLTKIQSANLLVPAVRSLHQMKTIPLQQNWQVLNALLSVQDIIGSIRLKIALAVLVNIPTLERAYAKIARPDIMHLQRQAQNAPFVQLERIKITQGNRDVKIFQLGLQAMQLD